MGAYECVEIHGGSSAACVFEIHPSAIVCRSSPSGGSLCRLRPHLSENN
jgi:hypothetical protein